MSMYNRFYANNKTTADSALDTIAALQAMGLESCWTIYQTSRSFPPTQFEERTIADITGKLRQYGSISPRQVEFLQGLLLRIANRANEQGQADCPVGKHTVIGTVLKCEFRDNQWGGYKMLLKVDSAGYRCWGSVPRSFNPLPGKGDKVQITATFERSKDDAKFGFFRRPTGKLLQAAQVDAELQRAFKLERTAAQ